MSAPRARWVVGLGAKVRIDLRWWLLALAMAAVAVRLGFWQMERAELKEAMQGRYFDRLAMAALPCAHLAAARDVAFLRIALTGRFEPGREYLWDNRTYQGQAGYEVLTPFVCTDGTRVLVDRGWIATGGDRARLPRWFTPIVPVSLVGFVFVPASGVQWFISSAWPVGWPKRVGRLDLERIVREQTLPVPVAADPVASDPAVADRVIGARVAAARATELSGAGAMYRYPIIIDGAGSGTFAYNFEPASISPLRNRGYVVQWFAIAVGILGYLGYR